MRLLTDYFHLPQDQFLAKWLTGRTTELSRQTTPQSWARIVSDLKNRQQETLVASNNLTQTNLVLAGPGSGKPTMLVHRIAYLVRVLREDPRSIIALAYNRHAATQIKSKLRQLISDQASQVTVLTCHAMAMRLAGTTFEAHADKTDRNARDIFDKILTDAADLLEGTRLNADDRDEQRDRLLLGYRWILVDEYQDIREHEYRLISALAGRTQTDPDTKLTLMAVGDDDQNIYSFNGSSNRFIRNFQQDYRAHTAYLTENYRSSRHIIEAANAVIAPSTDRLKKDNPITIDRRRRAQPPGGEWSLQDPVSQGRVQILPTGSNNAQQALIALQELQRIRSLDSPDATAAVIVRNWNTIHPFRVAADAAGVSSATWHRRTSPPPGTSAKPGPWWTTPLPSNAPQPHNSMNTCSP